MKIISFDTLYTQNITFKDIVPTIRYHRENVKYSLISPTKPYNTLVYYYSCNAKYTFPNHPPVVAVPGNIIYIPANTPYEIVNYNTHHPTPGSVKIEFGMYDSDGEEFVVADKLTNLEFNYPKYIGEKFFQMANLYSAPIKPLMNITAIFYDILHSLSLTAHMHNLSQNEFTTIMEGIRYIENDSEQTKSIVEIAEMCHVSASYFRSLFKKYSGLSPTDYRIAKKIERAKELITNDKMTVTEVAYKLNFKNVPYFSRLFKAKVGMTPNEYQKKYGD